MRRIGVRCLLISESWNAQTLSKHGYIDCLFRQYDIVEIADIDEGQEMVWFKGYDYGFYTGYETIWEFNPLPYLTK